MQKLTKNPIIQIDLKQEKVLKKSEEGEEEFALDSPEAFSIISEAWLRCGWDTKYVYSFSWLGRPVIQLPEDLIRAQEAIFHIKPDVIIETGVAHGGSLVFYASLLKAMGGGKVIGVDVEIRPHNRKALEEHFLFPMIDLVEGNSVNEEIFSKVKSLLPSEGKVMVFLDSNHTKNHVLQELNLYSSVVSPGSYIVVADGLLEDLAGAPRSREDWSWNNPKAAAAEFLKTNSQFNLDPPSFLFNEGKILDRITYWKAGWLRRKS